ncbi:MAG: hypothetical protein OXB95_07930 [Rhodobacteraceae bacterium]|nr:hypothetical protein [Paracoccaceae bacterium]
MIVLERNSLEFSFNKVHRDARCSIEFQRTLRIPDDGRTYPLPPGLGAFPIRHLDDYAANLPESWRKRGGVIVPMHQAEALWISFASEYPFAIKVAAGKMCAITGDPWVDHLNRDPQDYAVLPEQPWLDGFCVEKGVIRQFVAMKLGEGYTVEEQLTGAATHGGLQLKAFPMKAKHYKSNRFFGPMDYSDQEPGVLYSPAQSMGLAPGGRMKQDIYDDDHGLNVWDQRNSSRCFVTIVNSAQWMAITGERPPTEPPTARQYASHGLPWFDYYGGDAQAIAGSDKLRGLKSVVEKATEAGEKTLSKDEAIAAPHVIALGKSRPVREGSLDGSPW